MVINGLDKRIAIVTGASRKKGIGAAVCRALASRGADIFFTHWRSFDSMLPQGVDEDGPAKLQNELQELLPRFPMGRIGQPEDAARLIAFLASDEAACITGQVIHSRGGSR